MYPSPHAVNLPAESVACGCGLARLSCRSGPAWPGRQTGPALILLLLLLGLGGCAALRPSVSPLDGAATAVRSTLDPPAGWSMSAAGEVAGPPQAAALLDWWGRFDDPLLVELIDRALRDNTRINTAQAALRQAQALREVAAAALWPTLGVNASVGRNRSGAQGSANNVQLGLGASWVPDLFGGLRGAVHAADAAVLAGQASLGDAQVQIAAELALDYVLLRTAQARLAIAADNLASQQDTLQITRWREQAGLVTTLETEQARAAAEQTAAALPALQTSQVQLRHALAVLTGQAPAALDRQLPLWPAVVADAAPAPPATRTGVDTPHRPAFGSAPGLSRELPLSIPADTLRQRADVRGAQYQLAAALARVNQAQAQRWPSFAIGGSLGLSSVTLGALSSGGSVVSSLLASVNLPLFDGGAALARVAVQQAAVDQALQGYRAVALLALQQVEDALTALASDRLRLVGLGRAADAADLAAQLASQRYSAGLVDFQLVLETQRSRYATQDALASARADVSADQVRLFTALGGGWRADTEVAPDPDPDPGTTPVNRTSSPADATPAAALARSPVSLAGRP